MSSDPVELKKLVKQLQNAKTDEVRVNSVPLFLYLADERFFRISKVS
jgi:hypothetical protein